MFKDPHNSNNICQYINCVNSESMAGTNQKLRHCFTKLTVTRNFYFIGIGYLWNAIPDLDLSVITNKLILMRHFGSTLTQF